MKTSRRSFIRSFLAAIAALPLLSRFVPVEAAPEPVYGPFDSVQEMSDAFGWRYQYLGAPHSEVVDFSDVGPIDIADVEAWHVAPPYYSYSTITFENGRYENLGPTCRGMKVVACQYADEQGNPLEPVAWLTQPVDFEEWVGRMLWFFDSEGEVYKEVVRVHLD